MQCEVKLPWKSLFINRQNQLSDIIYNKPINSLSHQSIHSSICLYIRLPVILSVCLSGHPFICSSIHLFICLSILLIYSLYVCLSICLFYYVSVCLSVYAAVHLSFSIYLSVYTSIYLSIHFVYLSIFSCLSICLAICLCISPCEVFTFGGFTSLQLCFINGPFSCTAFYRAFHKHSAKPADVTFRRIDWTDDSLNRCSVMVLINTNYAFWLRLTDLLGARTSASGETSEER